MAAETIVAFTGRVPSGIPMEAVSAIGAGDSAIAGFIAATAAGDMSEACLRRAVAPNIQE